MNPKKHEPERMCAVCRKKQAKAGLLRVVRQPDGGEIVIDPTGRINGRGVYICKNKECAENAFKRKSLNRAFKKEVPAEVYKRLEEAGSIK